MSNHQEQPNQQFDLSWQPNNPYQKSYLEKLAGLSYEVSRPFIKIYSDITGSNFVGNCTWVCLNILSYVRGYSKANIKLLWKQAVLETGAFNSPMSNSDNNQFGMHLPVVRPTLTIGFRWNSSENSNVSIFDTIYDSVLDRMLWDEFNSIQGDSSDYKSEVIEDGYNENPSLYNEQWEEAEMPTSPISILIYIIVVIAILLLIKKLIF